MFQGRSWATPVFWGPQHPHVVTNTLMIPNDRIFSIDAPPFWSPRHLNPEKSPVHPPSVTAVRHGIGLRNDLHARRALYYCMMFMDPEKAVEARWRAHGFAHRAPSTGLPVCRAGGG